MAITYRVPLECFDRFIDTEFAHMNALVSRTRGKTVITLPVHVQCWRRMKGKLLCAMSRACIPDYSGLKQHISKVTSSI